jgi:hypothetical protein
MDLAFVFHADMLEKQYVNCAGMTRVYFTRYHFHHDGRPELIDCHVHHPFSTHMRRVIHPEFGFSCWKSSYGKNAK